MRGRIRHRDRRAQRAVSLTRVTLGGPPSFDAGVQRGRGISAHRPAGDSSRSTPNDTGTALQVTCCRRPPMPRSPRRPTGDTIVPRGASRQARRCRPRHGSTTTNRHAPRVFMSAPDSSVGAGGFTGSARRGAAPTGDAICGAARRMLRRRCRNWYRLRHRAASIPPAGSPARPAPRAAACTGISRRLCSETFPRARRAVRSA